MALSSAPPLPPPPPPPHAAPRGSSSSTSRGRGLDQHLQECNSSSHSRREARHQEPRSDRAPTPPYHPVSPKPLSEFIANRPVVVGSGDDVAATVPCSDVVTVATQKTTSTTTESSHSSSSSSNGGSVVRSPSKLVMAPVVRRSQSTSTRQSTSSSQVPLLPARPALSATDSSVDEQSATTEGPLLHTLPSHGGGGGSLNNAYDMAAVSDQPPAPAHRYASPTHTSKRKLTQPVNPFDPTTASPHKLRESDTVSGTSLTEDCTVSTAKDDDDYDDYDEDNAITDVSTSPLQRQIQSCYGEFCQYTSPIRRIASIAPMASPRSANSLRKPRLDEMATLNDSSSSSSSSSSQATLVPNVDWVLGTDDAWKSLPSPRIPRRQRSILHVPPPILSSPTKSPSTSTATTTNSPRQRKTKKDTSLRDNLDCLPNLVEPSSMTPRKSKHKVSTREARIMSVV
jgi:hypothetical protein